MKNFKDFFKLNEIAMSINSKSLTDITDAINDRLKQFGIKAFIRSNVIGVTKIFHNENPPREDTIMIEYFPDVINPSNSYYDVHDNIGRRWKESQFEEMIESLKDYFNQKEM